MHCISLNGILSIRIWNLLLCNSKLYSNPADLASLGKRSLKSQVLLTESYLCFIELLLSKIGLP